MIKDAYALAVILMAVALITACIAAGYNYGVIEGKRQTASSCQKHKSFWYSKIEYRCNGVYVMTQREWSEKYGTTIND